MSRVFISVFVSAFCRARQLIAMSDETKNVVSVKGGCLDGLDWGKAIHLWTKSAMVPIPEGSEAHSELSCSTEYGPTQEYIGQKLDQPGSDLIE